MSILDDDEPAINVTRFGGAPGKARERTMSGAVGPGGIRTRIVGDTMLRTRDGFNLYKTLESPQDATGGPRGLSVKTIWAQSNLPVVLDALVPGYAIYAKNPEQLQGSFTYWVGPGGEVSGSAGSVLYVGLAGKNNRHTRLKRAAAPTIAFDALPEYPAVPILFVDKAGVASLYLAQSNALATAKGAVVASLAPKTVNNKASEGARNATQLPQSISYDGKSVCLNAKDDKYFTEPTTANYYTDEKNYWYKVISFSGEAVDETAVAVRAVTYTSDVKGELVSQVKLNIKEDIEKITWSIVFPRDGSAFSPYEQWLYSGWDWALWYFPVGRLVDPLIEARHEMIIRSQRRDYFSWPLSIVREDLHTIGYVLGYPVKLYLACDWSRDIECEGQTYVATWDKHAPDAQYSFTNGQFPSPRVAVGASETDYKIVTIDVKESNTSYLNVAVGRKAITAFKVKSSTTGWALLKKRTNVATSYAWNWDPWAADIRISPGMTHISGSQPAPGYDGDDPLVRANWPHPPSIYLGAYYGANWSDTSTPNFLCLETEFPAMQATILAFPTLASELTKLKGESGTTTIDEDYVTTMNMAATSQHILACDPNLDLMIYLEITVEYTNATLVSPAAKEWLATDGDEQPHTVTCKVVADYIDDRYEKELFNVTVVKPMRLYKTEVTAWHKWPIPPAQVDPGMKLYANPILLPTPTAFNGIDNVFKHQGVNPCFAGFNAQERRSPESCGYPADADLKRVVFCKRFKLTDDNMEWLLKAMEIDECRRGATAENATEAELQAYYYSPELRELVINTTYEVAFDQRGFVEWMDEVPPTSPNTFLPSPPNRTAECWRI